jgi:aryl-alcohol dehydrogenase-like predicted oxidoreductase
MTGTGTMKTRTIGSGVPGGGLAVSAIGLGCMVMPGAAPATSG